MTPAADAVQTASGCDADPLLLRGGSTRPARGRGGRRKRSGRWTCSRCAGPTICRRGPRRRHHPRLDVQRHQGAGLGTYLREYLAFLLRAGIALTRAHPPPPIRAGPGPYAARLPRLCRAPASPRRRPRDPGPARGDAGVLPEPVPRTRGSRRVCAPAAPGTRRDGICQRRVTVNDALGERLLAIGVPASKVTVVPNAPTLARFDPARYPARPFMADGTLRLVYAGALSPIYELDVVLDAIARLAADPPDPAGLPRPVRPRLRRDPAPRPGRRARGRGRGDVPRPVAIDAVPRPSPPPTSGWRRPDGPTSPTSRSRQRPSNTRRWAGPWSRRACPWSSGRRRGRRDLQPGDADDLAAELLRVVDGTDDRRRGRPGACSGFATSAGNTNRRGTSSSSTGCTTAPRRRGGPAP